MYNIVRTYAIPVEKQGNIIDARNRYEWTVCAEITLPETATDAEVEAAYEAAHVPTNALCVAVEMVEA